MALRRDERPDVVNFIRNGADMCEGGGGSFSRSASPSLPPLQEGVAPPLRKSPWLHSADGASSSGPALD